MPRNVIFFFACLLSTQVAAQKFSVAQSEVSFFSDAAVEDIEAKNKKVSGLFNVETGEIVFSIPIAEFQFDKSLMKEHFNEKYMESDKFPKATFQGKVEGFSKSVSGKQDVRAMGKLTIHGETNNINVPGSIEKVGDNYVVKSKFIVKLVDYKIEIPTLLWQNIAEQVEVTTEFTFKPH